MLTSALAGIAGIYLGMIGILTTDIAFKQILLIIAVAIVAGLGSIYGVAIAGLALGLAMNLSVIFIPNGYKSAVAYS